MDFTHISSLYMDVYGILWCVSTSIKKIWIIPEKRGAAPERDRAELSQFFLNIEQPEHCRLAGHRATSNTGFGARSSRCHSDFD